MVCLHLDSTINICVYVCVCVCVLVNPAIWGQYVPTKLAISEILVLLGIFWSL